MRLPWIHTHTCDTSIVILRWVVQLINLHLTCTKGWKPIIYHFVRVATITTWGKISCIPCTAKENLALLGTWWFRNPQGVFLTFLLLTFMLLLVWLACVKIEAHNVFVFFFFYVIWNLKLYFAAWDIIYLSLGLTSQNLGLNSMRNLGFNKWMHYIFISFCHIIW